MTILKWYSIILMLCIIGFSIYDGTKEPKEYGIPYVIFTIVMVLPVLVYLIIK